MCDVGTLLSSPHQCVCLCVCLIQMETLFNSKGSPSALITLAALQMFVSPDLHLKEK